MKYQIISAALLALVGTLSVADAQGLAPNGNRRIPDPDRIRGAGCSSNPYDPSFRIGCQSGASAMNKKTIHPKVHTGRSAAHQ
jgi:hypothetical protein